MVDFVALRNQILHGEGEEVSERQPTSVETESFKLATGIPLFVGLSTLAFIVLDKFKLKMLGKAQIPLMMLMGIAPLSYGVGRLTRGLSSHEEMKRYERLLEATQSAYADLDEQAAEFEGDTESQPEQLGYLDPDAQYFFEPAVSANHLNFGAVGLQGDAIGQEIFAYEAHQDLFSPRQSFESQTFGW